MLLFIILQCKSQFFYIKIDQILIISQYTNMEEKSIIHNNTLQTSLSDWKLRHNIYQTSRNYRQLQNRLNILQLEKKKKLKDIENKLNCHKKFVQNKIYKYQLKSSIQNWSSSEINRANSNSRIFQAIKQSRNQSIKKNIQQMRTTKHKLFEQIKNQRIENQKKINMKRMESLEEKMAKRNRVRLIEIGCKENIETFWNSRLDSFQQDKKMDMSRKLKQHEDNLKRLEKLQINEESLLGQIKRAEQVETELNELISNEKSMDGSKLDNLYYSKVINSSD